MPAIRVVMLGFRNAGKSSVGDTILGQRFFKSKKTVQRVRGEGKVAERHDVTVVKAPGWGEKQSLNDTSELAREQIILSASLCPHAVLLVMRTGVRFTETSRRAVQGHVELLGDAVWNHTIVMFTHGEWLGGRTIEDYIEAEGKPLQWVVEKCGNRYHVFSNNEEGRDVQVTELFEKIEETVAGNEGRHYEIDEGILKAMEEREEKEKSKAEQMKNKHLRAEGASKPGTLTYEAGNMPGKPAQETAGTEANNGAAPKTQPYSKELRIVLLGQLHAGKSVLGNSLLGKHDFCSENALQSVKIERDVSGRKIMVVNSPGWGYEQPLSDTPEFIKKEIMRSVSQCHPGPHVLFLVVNVNKPFTESHRRSVQDHAELLGADVWKRTVLLLTSGNEQGDISIEPCTGQGGKSLQWLKDRCHKRYAVLGMKSSSPNKEPLLVADGVAEENNYSHYEMTIDSPLKKVKKENKAEEREGRSVEELWKCVDNTKISDQPDRRVILLGPRGAGKTAAARTILGRDDLLTWRHSVESVEAEARVSGRLVTVIRASDWPREQLLSDTAELTKQEITISLTLCPPGPDCILVVVNLLIKFTEASRRAVQEHLELLTEDAWKNSMVLFTCEEDLVDGTIQQYIQSEGKPLQWLVERCGHRYHVLNTKSRGKEGTVMELLKKIDDMVDSGGGHFKPDMKMLSEVEAQRRKEVESAEARRVAVQKQRQELQAKLKAVT